MFFGLQVKSAGNQAKPITLSNALRLSQAVLEPGNNLKKEPVCVMVEYNKKQFILCVLDPNKSWQSPLDLYFEGGSQVKFFIKGSGTVHLTGYENFDDLDDMSMSMSDEEVDSDEEAEEKNGSALSADKKIAPKNTPQKEKTNGFKAPNRKNVKDQPKESARDDDDDDDESDDEDFDADDLDEDDMDDEDMSDEDVDEVEESSDLESDDE